MMTSLIVACLWVLLATIVAFLPMSRQYTPAMTLLAAAPVIIIWIGYDYGWWVAALGTAAFVSMFRYPLRHIWRRLKGKISKVPK